MRHILSGRHRDVLARFARGNVLVAFDYDGTLAPIASDPTRARMRPATRRLLVSVTRRYPCVVISGRSRHDLEHRLAGVPVCHLSGNYGLEPWEPDPRYLAQVRNWVRRLERRLTHWSGVAIEDKAYSITVHYRHARRKLEAIEAIRTAVGELPGARAVQARQAISVLPARAGGKGAALERTLRLLACDTAIYVGDDQTDEDAFGAIGPDQLLAIRVGGSGLSNAGYAIRRQADIDRFLRALAQFRRLPPAEGRPVRLARADSRASIACA